MVQKDHFIPESKRIASEIALLKMKLQKVLQVERLFDSFLSLAPEDIIVSFSGEKMVVKRITKKEIFVEHDGDKESSALLKEDLFRRKFPWIKEIQKSTGEKVSI